MKPFEMYLSLMQTIRGRLDIIDELRGSPADNFLRAESAAFHARKIVEGIAFGCLVATENGLKTVPRDAKGQWNAEDIFKSLKRKGLSVFPSPSVIRLPTDKERLELNVASVLEGIPERRLTPEELIKIYQDLHWWLHEANPYTHASHSEFYAKRSPKLWTDLTKIQLLVEKHLVVIQGAAFFCVMHDNRDNQTKVIALNKTEDLPPSWASSGEAV